MIGHLGSKVTLLVDGRLPAGEEERAWEHVHACHGCRGAVEREGWVKTQLAQWSMAPEPSAASLKDALLAPSFAINAPAPRTHGALTPVASGWTQSAVATAPVVAQRRHMVAISGSALGVAVMGVMALGAAPAANAPLPDRRATVTSIVPPASESRISTVTPQSSTVPVRLRTAREKMAQ